MKVFTLQRSRLLTALLLFFTAITGIAMRDADPVALKPVVIGYIGGYKGIFDMESVDAAKLTHVNYAFVNVKNSKAFLDQEKTDSVNLRNLSKLKKKNKELKLLISIGGWAWSENFSDAALTDSTRKIFARTAVEIIRKYQLDGVDIDWEYPSIKGEEDNIYRPEDKQNFTLLLAAVRAELDIFQKETNQHKLLTIAVGGWADFLKAVELDKAQQYLDYINLMTYDFYNNVAAHHSNLYPSKKYADGGGADRTVTAFLAAGIAPEKLVLGIPFYGRSFTVKPGKMGIGDTVTVRNQGRGYKYIKEVLMKNDSGYTAYWDEDAKAPYLYNSALNTLFFYDDERAVAEKCRYVMQQKIAGVMFWEYNDDADLLLRTIHNTLK